MGSLVPAPAITPVLQADATPLDALTMQVAKLSAARQQQVVSELTGVLDLMADAQAQWQQFLDQNNTDRLDPFTAVMYIGATRARQLHRTQLQLRARALALTEVSDIAFRDTMGIAPELDIVEAYDQMQEGESAQQRASAALATISQRMTAIRATLEAIT